jgi:hypothetical protein
MPEGYPRYYAVNDRLVALAEVEGGGVDCLAFDFVTGDFVVAREYSEALTPGSGKDVDAFTPEEFARVLAERRAEVLVDWARRIAAGSGETPDGLLRDLGIDRALVPWYGDEVIEPPPLGATRVRLRGGVPSMASVEVSPAAGTLTLGMLDARLGERQELPRLHWDSPYTLAYDVRSADPPGRCTVFARTLESPGPDTAVVSVTLRTEPKQAG